jgi:hypothetical protein
VTSSVQAAKNEDVFREVNEQILALQDGFLVPLYTTFVCECSRGECHEAVEATLAEYTEVRADPTHFLIVHGHLDADHERVVRSTDRFAVVQKFGLAGDVAEDEVR